MIQVKNLTQVYKSGKGIFEVDFEVKEGEVFGYLGPNGAGKTTTIRNILGFANATEGSVDILGIDPRTDSEKLMKDIGYLPGEIAFFPHFTGKEFLDFMQKLRGTSNQEYRNELIKRFKLEDHMAIRKMSKGMKQKLGIVAAFMHDPKILILDEPTSGLDPLMQQIFMEALMEEKAKGKTILMSSHIFEEVERLCDRAGIIKNGRIIAIEDVHSLKQKREDIFVIKTKSNGKQLMDSALDVSKVGQDTYEVVIHGNYRQFFEVMRQVDVESMESKKQSIEDLFMKYYNGEVQ